MKMFSMTASVALEMQQPAITGTPEAICFLNLAAWACKPDLPMMLAIFNGFSII